MSREKIFLLLFLPNGLDFTQRAYYNTNRGISKT